jgi:hypothetical protein
MNDRNFYLNVVVIIDQVAIHSRLEDQLSEDLAEFLSAGEHTDRQDLYHFGIHTNDLLFTHISGYSFLHEVESGSGRRAAEPHLHNLNEKISKRHHIAHAKVCPVFCQEGNPLALQVADCVVKELKSLTINVCLPPPSPDPLDAAEKDILLMKPFS